MTSIQLSEIEGDSTSILVNLKSNTTLLIIILVLFIIFLFLTSWFVYYSVYQIQQNITTINKESKEALAIISSGQTDVESTLTKINASAAETITTEEDIIGFIRAACTVPPFSITPTCKTFNGQ